MVDPHLVEIIHKLHADLLGEQIGQITRRDADILRHLRERQILIIVLFQIILRALDNPVSALRQEHRFFRLLEFLIRDGV